LTAGFVAFLARFFTAFALKRMDLAPADRPLAGFLLGFGLDFALLAISPATYTGSTS
jgi:hypothetical protein